MLFSTLNVTVRIAGPLDGAGSQIDKVGRDFRYDSNRAAVINFFKPFEPSGHQIVLLIAAVVSLHE